MNILSLLLNYLDMQKGTAGLGAQSYMDMASHYGSFEEAAKNFPQFLKSFEQTQGAFPRTPTLASMTPLGQPETPAGAPAGFTEPSTGFESTLVNPNAPAALAAQANQPPVSPIRGMFNMLLGKQQPQIPGTEPVFPEYKPTPEQAESRERTALSREGRELQRNTAFQNVIKGFIMGNRPEEPELRQEEIDMLSKGVRPPGLTPRPSAGIEEIREQQKGLVRKALETVGYDISKLSSGLQVLGMDTGQFKREGDKWLFSKEEQAKIEAPVTTKYEKGGQHITEIIRKPGAAAEVITAPRQLAPIEANKPLEETHVKGAKDEAVRQWLPIIMDRMDKDPKYGGLSEVRKIVAAMSKDPYTGQVNLYELAPYMTPEERKRVDRHLQTAAQLMKNKKLSSPEAWAGAQKTIHFREGTTDYDIPVSEVGAFQKLHPKAKRVEE